MIKRVFFLGAGFSKAIDKRYKDLSGLSDEIENRIKNKKDSLYDHYQNEIPGIVKGNIEALLTYLSTDFPWKTPKQKLTNKALYVEITETIQEYFIELSKKGFSEEEHINIKTLSSFQKFIGKFHADLGFVTLNYDMILERVFFDVDRDLFQKGCLSLDAFYKYPIMEIERRIGNPYIRNGHCEAPPLLKLHGSANWFWEGVSPSDQIYYVQWNESPDMRKLLNGLSPYIIPPVLDKNAFYNHNAIKSIWQQAEKILSEADEIYIVGFSFPPTDVSVRFLFQSALRQSNATVYVINAETEKQMRKRYESVFGENDSDRNYTLNYEYCGKKRKDYGVFCRFLQEKMKDI